MDFFGMSSESVYLTTLIIFGLLTVLFIFFGDIVEGITEAIDFINPTLILAFFTFLSASGYLLELLTPLHSLLIFVISIVIALILDTLLNLFVLIPLSSAEESLVYSQDSLKGRVGKVIIAIPVDGFGEVVLNSNSGTIAKSAVSFDEDAIPEGKKVLVIDVQDGILHVKPYDSYEGFLPKSMS